MASITSKYEPYSFDDDDEGPGCGIAHHEPSCLCDVDLSLSPASAENAPKLAYAELAKRALYERDVAPTFENFAAELLGLYDTARELGVRLKASPAELEELRTTYWEKLGGAIEDGHRADQVCNTEVRALLTAGLSVRACVRFLERPRDEVLGMLSMNDTDDMDGLEAAIDMLMAGATSYRTVQRETGVSFQRAAYLASLLGVESKATEARKRGGGYTYTAEQLKELERLYRLGKSYTEIAVATGVKRPAVAKYVARKLRDAA